jgi:UDPglucose 6-dehydrogenase
VLVGGTRGKTIGILGLAFKAGTDDVRGSPALALASALLASGARVRAFDPEAGRHPLARLEGLELAATADEVFHDADAVVVATEWPEFRSLEFETLRSAMRFPLVVDGRRLLDASLLRSLGYRVATLGSPSLAAS